MSKELQQQIEALQTENQQLRRQLEQKSKVATRALASYQQRALHMEIIRQKNDDLDRLAGDLELRAEELETTNKALEKEVVEREAAEKATRETQALYESTVNVLPQNIIRKDKELRFVFGNKAFLELLGMSLEELVGKTDYDFYPKELADQYIKDDRQVLESGEPFETIESHKAPGSDDLIYVRVMKTPTRNEDGDIDGLQIVFWDVTERVRSEQALAKRATELETVARVGMAASTILDVNKLLQQVTDLTKESFGLYHAHIYLLDESGNTLSLAAGAGEVGRKMVSQGWSIPFGQEQSLVARAARSKAGVVVNNVREDPEWLPNQLLPDTHAELAVPMIAGDQLLGVIDIQADEVDHFTEDDVRIQTTFAAQIAVALQNARQFQQTEQAGNLLRKRVEELDALTDLGREIAETPPIPALLQSVSQRIPAAMQYPDICKVAITYEDQTFGNPEAVDLPAQIVQALRIGNEVVGRIYISYQEQRDFLNEESALLGGIANRIGGYIESRRLFEQTEALYIGSERVIRGETMDEVLQALVQSTALGHLERANFMFFEHPWDDQMPESMTVTALWERSGKARVAPGAKLSLVEYSTFHSLKPDEPVLFQDMITDERVDEAFRRRVQERVGMRSMISFPLVAGGQWFGILNGQSNTPIELNDEEIRQASNLIDQAAIVIQSRLLFEEAQHRAAELEENTNFLDSIIDNIPSGLFVKDAKDLRMVRWNKANEAIHGLKAKDLLGKTDYDLFTPKEADFFVNTDRKVLDGGELVDIPEETVETPHLGARVLRTRKLPVFSADGTPRYLLGISEDITEQKEAEQRLEEVSALQRAIVNYADYAIISATPEGILTSFNPAAERMLGYTAEELVGKESPAIFHKLEEVVERAGQFSEELGETIEPGFDVFTVKAQRNLPNQYEWTYVRKDGTEFPVLLTVSAIRDEEGDAVGFFGLAQDITKQKNVEGALARERDLLQMLMDNSPEYIFFRDRESRFIRTNDSHAQTMLGLSTAEEAIGKTDFDLFAKEDAQRFYDEEQEIMRTGQAIYDREGKVPSIEGNVRWVSEHKIPIRDENDNVTGLLGISREITERKEAEAERERVAARLAEERGLLRTLIDSLPDFVYVKDRDGKFLLTNQALAELMNVESPEDLVGKSDADFYPPELANRYLADEQALMNAGEPLLDYEEPNMDQKTGEQTWTSTTKVPFRNVQGQIVGLVGVSRDISQSKNVEIEREQLLTQVQRLATIVENHPDFIGVGSMEGQALYINPAGLELMGLPLDHTITSMGAEDFYPPDQARQVLQVGLPAALEQGSWSTESVLQRADGSTLPIEQTLAINFDTSGNPASFSITIRDITGRKQADAEREQLLEEVEATYRQYVRGEWEHFLKDEHGGRWHVEHGQSGAESPQPANGNSVAKIETPIALRGQQIGKLNLEDVDPDRKWSSEELALIETVSEQLAQTIENLRLFENTQRGAWRDHFVSESTAQVWSSVEIEGVMRIAAAQLGDKLQASEVVIWQQVSKDIPASGYRFVDGTHQEISPASDAWLPPMKQAVLQKQLVTQTHPGNDNSARGGLAVPLLLRGEVIGVLGVEREETPDWAEEEVTAVESVAEQIARALENARLSQEQEKTIEQLQEIDRLKSEFLTSMSHELRTPLNSIIGFADVMLQGIDGELNDMAMNDIRLIYNSGQHLLALINDILDISKIEAGMMELVREPIPIEDTLQDVLAASTSLVKDKPVEIVADAAEGMPPVFADKLRLHQILLNMVSNAAKFTHEGSVTIKARLDEQLPDTMMISVIDTGIGIPEDKLEDIFDRFQQADSSTTRQYGGTGLGLAICRQLVEMHGGELKVKSKVDVGSEFYFTIPVAETS